MIDAEVTHTARPRMIVDCDPGHDDAVALIVAAHVAEIRGIVTVGGNADLDRTTHNALVIRDLIGIDAPIHRGVGHPIVAKPHHSPSVHGESGLDGADLPTPVTPLDGTDGVGFIVDACRAEEGLWLVPTGPLTNIGLALRQAPDIAHRIAGVSLMGGGSFGNRSAVAEFNIWADPDAARVVFESGADLTMAGLDVTHRFQATTERIDAVRDIDGDLAAVLADLLDFFSSMYRSRHDDGALAGAAIAAALVPPIATAGLQIAFGQWQRGPSGETPVVGPLLLVSVNVLTIMIGSSFILWARGIRSDRKLSVKARWAPRMTALLLLLSLLALVFMALPK